jgi:hypothetical protein
VFAPLGKVIEQAGRGYASLPAVQRLSMSPVGDAIYKGTDFVSDLSVLAGTAAGFGAASKVRLPAPPSATTKTNPLVQKRLNELQKLESNNAVVRRATTKAKSQGINSKRLLAETDLLHGAVDENGTIRTQSAIQELNDFIRPYEKTISQSLQQEGTTIPLQAVKNRLYRNVNRSGLEGAALENAFAKVEAEIRGLQRRTDGKGNITLGKVHDAKINKYSTIDYLNPAAKRADKAIARGLKELVEDNAKSVDVQALNRELSRHFSVLNLLEKLDGKKVDGGKLGKYFAQTVGTIVGSHFGPLGAIAGAEIAGRIKSAAMSSKLKGTTGAGLEVSDAMKAAQAKVQSINDGSRNQSQTPTMAATAIPQITPSIKSQTAGRSQRVINLLTPDTKEGTWTGTASSKPSKATDTSTSNAPGGKGGVSGQKTGTSGSFDGVKVYHGTEARFDNFKLPSETSMQEMGPGIYFYTDKAKASGYAGKNGRVIEATVPTGKFATLDDFRKARSEANKDGFNLYAGFKEAVKRLQAKGYVGIKDDDIISVFDPKDIKPSPSTPKGKKGR